jgi:hypothetical protein
MATTLKQTWPELVGKSGKVATAEINKERPELDCHILEDHSMVGMDHRND